MLNRHQSEDNCCIEGKVDISFAVIRSLADAIVLKEQIVDRCPITKHVGVHSIDCGHGLTDHALAQRQCQTAHR
jgi:hypothetical protein